MKYAFMSFSTPELTLDEMLVLARRLGYDGVEPRLDAGHAHGVEVTASRAEREEFRRKAADSAVAIACLATSCCFANPEARQQAEAETHLRVDLAADVGAPCIRVFGGEFPRSLSRQEAIAGMAQLALSVADHAAERGVTICIETHDAWCDPSHLAEVLRRVDHPAVGANWDVMHPVRMGLATIDESFNALRPWIRHLHVHDGVTTEGQLRLVPIGTGDIDHRRVIELLKGVSYSGFISGEWIGWEPYETHLPRELAALKAYESRG